MIFNKKRKFIAFAEIFIMVAAIFAFAFVLNAEIVRAPSVAPVAGANAHGASAADLAAESARDIAIATEEAKLTAAEEAIVVKESGGVGGAGATGTVAEYVQGVTGTGWFGTAVSAVVQGAVWGAAAYFAVKLVGGWLDKDGKYKLEINALAAGAGAGFAVAGALTAYGTAITTTTATGTILGSTATSTFLGITWTIPGVGWAVGIIVAIATYLLTSEKDYKTEDVVFKCMSWQAPIGGVDCEKCNIDKNIPCSEYRCKSLGQGCGIINAGTENEKCIWMNPRDASSPGIKPWNEPLTEGYEYSDVVERPAGGGSGNSGMKIVKKGGGCIDAFTAIEFGIESTESSQCKADFKHTEKLDAMGYYLGDNNMFEKTHSQKISLPGTQLLNSLSPEIQSDGEYNLYIRCRDGNGNENVDEFVVSFCVDKGPDLTAPLIKRTNPNNKAPVQYQVDKVDVGVYTNEPAECRWSRTDANYDNMENQMICNNQVWEMNTELLYTCKTTLTGIEDRKENRFYFRCMDLSNNTMKQSYPFSLIGTQPLDIIKVGPNETVGGSTTTVVTTLHVETDNGYKNGESACYYSPTGNEGSYIEFFETGGNKHNQNLDLTSGDYHFYFKCIDAGGNSDAEEIKFRVSVDNRAPIVVRAYNENDKIKIVTNENSDCRYSAESCNFDFSQGTVMPYEGKTEHYAEWHSNQKYYIKCSDDYGNIPEPSSCSIIVRPSIV